jgi:hypothetical protein
MQLAHCDLKGVLVNTLIVVIRLSTFKLKKPYLISNSYTTFPGHTTLFNVVNHGVKLLVGGSMGLTKPTMM